MAQRFAFITLLTTLAAISPAAAGDRSTDSGSAHWIEVAGEGSVNAAPDFARVTLDVTNTGKTAGEAMADNAKAASALVSLIKAEGVAPADIQTSNLSISPIFSQPSRGQVTAPTITGYSVSNIVALKFHDIPRLGGLLDKAVTAPIQFLASALTIPIPARCSTKRARLRSPTPSARLTSTPTPQAPRSGG